MVTDWDHGTQAIGIWAIDLDHLVVSMIDFGLQVG